MTQQQKSALFEWLQPIVVVVGVIAMIVTLQVNSGHQAKQMEEMKENLKEQQKDVNEIKTDIAVIKSKINIK